MALPFDETNPANTQGAKLGALRIRDMKAILNDTLGLLFSLSTADSTSATVSVVADSVSGTMLQDHASDDSQRAVDSNHIKTGAVIAAKLGALAVETAAINTGAVVAAKIGALAVETAAINTAAVTTGKLADSAVTQLTLASMEVTSEKFARASKWVRFIGDLHTFTVGQVARVSNVVSVTWASHGFAVGDSVTLATMTPSSFDGSHVITAVSANSFDFVDAGSDESNTGSAGTAPVVIQGGSFALTGSALVAALSGSVGTVTVTTTGSHGYATGDRVRISGATTADFNGEFPVTVTGAATFTYAAAGSGTAAGLPKSQKLARDITVVRNSAGTFALTYATSFSDIKYGVSTTCGDPGSGVTRYAGYSTLTVSGVLIVQRGASGVAGDVPLTVRCFA